MRTTHLALACALAVAACGGAGADEEQQAGAPASQVEQLEAGEHTVIIRMTDDMKFIPENPTVSVGDTIVWINEGDLPHTATDDSQVSGLIVLPDGAEPWDSGLLDPSHTYRVVVTAPGEYTYVCFLHVAAGMVGRFTAR